MKTKFLASISLLALLGAFAVPSVQAGEETSAQPVQEKPVSKTDLKKYDADKDGVLNAEEKAARDAAKAKAKAAKEEKAKNAATTDETQPTQPKPAEKQM